MKHEDVTETFDSDAKLSYWVNPKNEIKKEEAKSDHSHFESNVDNNGCEEESEEESIGLTRSRNLQVQHSSRQQTLKEVLEAPVTDNVATLCKYQCPKCRMIYKGRGPLNHHFRQTKHENLTINYKNCNKYLVEVVAYKCHACTKIMLCERNIIREYMQSRHKTTISNIIQRGKSCKEKSQEIKYVKMKRTRRANSKQYLDKFYTNLSNNYEMSDKLGNYCIFNCQKCDYSANRWQLMPKH